MYWVERTTINNRPLVVLGEDVRGKGKKSIVLWLDLSLSVSLCLWTVSISSSSQFFLPTKMGQDGTVGWIVPFSSQGQHQLESGRSFRPDSTPGRLGSGKCVPLRAGLLRTVCSGIFPNGPPFIPPAGSMRAFSPIFTRRIWLSSWRWISQDFGALHAWVPLEFLTLRVVSTEPPVIPQSPYPGASSHGGSAWVSALLAMTVSPTLGTAVCPVSWLLLRIQEKLLIFSQFSLLLVKITWWLLSP